MVNSGRKARIEIVCEFGEKERLQNKASQANLSLSAFLVKRGLGDDRARDTEDSTSLAQLYSELLRLNQNLETLPNTSLVQQAIALAQEVRREIVLHRLSRRAASESQR